MFISMRHRFKNIEFFINTIQQEQNILEPIKLKSTYLGISKEI